MPIPEGMQRTAEQHPDVGELMSETIALLESLGLEPRGIEKEDIRANFPGTRIPMVAVQTGPEKKVRVEIRVDATPCTVLYVRDDTTEADITLVRLDRTRKALWNVHRIESSVDLDACKKVLERVLAFPPPK